MNKKAWYALGVLVIVIAGAWFAVGSSFKGSWIPSDRSQANRGDNRSATPVPRGYSSEPKTPSGEPQPISKAFSPEALPVNDNINRAQLAMLIFNTLDNGTKISLITDSIYTNCVSDLPVPPAKNGTANIDNVICYMMVNNIMKGYADGKFKPYDTVTRGEATKFFEEAFNHYSYYYKTTPAANPFYGDVSANAPYYTSIKWLVENSAQDIVANGKNSFFPSNMLSNGRAIYIVNKIKQNVPKQAWASWPQNP